MTIDAKNFKERLVTELETLTEELQKLGIHNPDVKEDWIATPEETVGTEPDLNDQADQAEDWNERRATLSLLETQYNNISRALEKIAAGTYGVCEVCGEPIEADRLDANPSARTCKAHLEEEAGLNS